MNQVKTLKTRDSAVTILRKLGIAKDKYSKFIVETDDGKWAVKITEAEKSLGKAAEPTVAKPTVAEVKKVEKARKEFARAVEEKRAKVNAKPVYNTKAQPRRDAPVEKAAPEENQSQFIRRLIREGYTNQEVWVAFAKAFDAPATSKYFPAWYRWKMKKSGEQV